MDETVYAGVAWDETGFTVATRETETRAADVRDVHRQLHELAASANGSLVCVVESTDGMLDGGLMSAGFTVVRADPAMLPNRPSLGSVTARELVDAAEAQPRELAPLVLESGSLTGRFPEVDGLIEQAATARHELIAAGRCLIAGPRTADTVALTFDDGPHPPYTDRILDTLARYGVPATFFCVGLHARTHRDLLKRMADDGHRLGNHTYSHPLLADLDSAQVRVQLDRTDEAIGAEGLRLFRPPYGAINPSFMKQFAEDPSQRSMVLWDVEPYDWARPGTDYIADKTLADVRPGSIVLLHDGGGDRSQTVDALPRIVETLLERNYTFVTADALF